MWNAEGRPRPGKTMKTRAILAVLAILLSAPAGQAQAFKDLPGVVPSDATEEYSNRNDANCTLSVEVPRSTSSRWMPRDVYVCEKNGIKSSSTRPPPSSIRALRGLNW
ncbi:MAG: hypothetical protein BGO06_05510 [Shinella sp. 65-6]|nr:MAG: hypothetical protein BGO06_05510 [Shinella sp. 65-6]